MTVLCPGPVPTEFGQRAGIAKGLGPDFLTVSPEAVAVAGYRGLMRGQRTVVPGLANKLVTLAVRAAPHGLLLRAIGSRQDQRRAADNS